MITDSIKNKFELYHSNPIVRFVKKHIDNNNSLREVKYVLRKNKLPSSERRKILSLVRDDRNINRKIERLDTMQNLFKYWHVAHFPFALVMLIIMLIHIGVTIVFGYRWIF